MGHSPTINQREARGLILHKPHADFLDFPITPIARNTSEEKRNFP